MANLGVRVEWAESTNVLGSGGPDSREGIHCGYNGGDWPFY